MVLILTLILMQHETDLRLVNEVGGISGDSGHGTLRYTQPQTNYKRFWTADEDMDIQIPVFT